MSVRKQSRRTGTARGQSAQREFPGIRPLSAGSGYLPRGDMECNRRFSGAACPPHYGSYQVYKAHHLIRTREANVHTPYTCVLDLSVTV